MDSVSGVGVLDKAFLVLNALVMQPSSLSEVAERTGLPRATAHRLLLALEHHGAVRRDDNGVFCVGLSLIGFGRAASDQFPWIIRARDVARELRDVTGESVQVYVPEGDGRRCVASFESTHGLRWIVPEGSLLPLVRGSAGRVLSGQKLSPAGWIETSEDREKGVASVSAPIYSNNEVVAAISLSGPVERVTASPGKKFGTRVVGAAKSLSQ
jgi:DNA-binding IclR family transcriptional regulator